MKRLGASLIIGVTIALAISFVLKGKPATTKEPKLKLERNQSAWSNKQTFKPFKYRKEVQQPEGFNSEITDLDTARKYLGFELKLPKSPKATAAGEPKIIVPKEAITYVKTKGTPPKPDNPIAGGPTIQVKYPNGLVILIKIRHPQDPTRNYQLHVEDTNKRKAYWTEKGYMDGKFLELTKVNNFQGYEEEAGFNFVGFLGSDTPTPELREPRPAFIVWYDDKNWAEYSVNAPLGVSLKELREVVDSIYQ